MSGGRANELFLYYMARDNRLGVRLIFWLGGAFFQVDDDLLRQQAEAYKIQGVDENEQVTAQQLKKKRKQQQAIADEVGDLFVTCLVEGDDADALC